MCIKALIYTTYYDDWTISNFTLNIIVISTCYKCNQFFPFFLPNVGLLNLLPGFNLNPKFVFLRSRTNTSDYFQKSLLCTVRTHQLVLSLHILQASFCVSLILKYTKKVKFLWRKRKFKEWNDPFLKSLYKNAWWNWKKKKNIYKNLIEKLIFYLNFYTFRLLSFFTKYISHSICPINLIYKYFIFIKNI